MIDAAGRNIDYVRISITDKCNLRCIYCMPEEGVVTLRHEDLLSHEEILRLAHAFSSLGIRYIKLTGGEPMARKGCLSLVRSLKAIPGIKQVTMTTNGMLLADCMEEAAAAGLDGMNISLDTLDPTLYAKLTRRQELTQVLKAIDTALACDIPKVKVNVVPVRGYTDSSLIPLATLARDKPLDVRFIELMPVGCGADLTPIPQPEILAQLEAAFGPATEDFSRHGNGPAVYYQFAGFQGGIGFISALSHQFCDQCSRVRLTPDGELKLCLNHAKSVPLKPLLRAGISDEDLVQVLRDAIYEKPTEHGFGKDISDQEQKKMFQIGG